MIISDTDQKLEKNTVFFFFFVQYSAKILKVILSCMGVITNKQIDGIFPYPHLNENKILLVQRVDLSIGSMHSLPI